MSRCPSITGRVTTRPAGNLSLPSEVTWVQPWGSRAYIASFQAATLKLKTPYSVDGRTILGRTLTVTDGKFKPSTATVSYQWLRNGVPIPGATGVSYIVATDDVAQLLGVVVTGSVPGVEPISQTISLTNPVRSVPVCSVRTQRKKGGKVIVHFEVDAPGILEPDGSVVIKVGPHQRTVTLKKGKAIARFVDVDPGRYRVRCQYAGGTLVVAGKVRDWVRVPGKGPNA